jgi:CheY-like chemotaxis protein
MRPEEKNATVKSTAPMPTEDRIKELEDLVNTTIQSKRQFINTVNHQIRTLSNAIIGFSELLRCDELSDIQSDYTMEIRGAADALVSVTSNASDLSKIEAGELNIDMTECPFDEILDEVDSLICLKAKAKGLKFAIQLCDELPAQIRTDSVKLCRCLSNLCNNIINLTNSGDVYLDISLKTCDKAPFIRFDIYGNGTDVYGKGRKKMFGPFGQENTSKQETFTPVDLCLVLTNELTTLLGGNTWETEMPDGSSVFSLAIPAGVDIKKVPLLQSHKSVSAEVVESASVVERKCDGHILLVEDDPSNQTVMSMLLETMGLRVSVASDGLEAVEKAFDEEFDLVLMDIKMPRMNGYEATKLLREKGFKSPIIALSASTPFDGFEEDKKSIFDDFITKPVDGRKLFEVITQYKVITQIN